MAGGGGAKQARKAKGRDAKNKAFKKGCARSLSVFVHNGPRESLVEKYC